MGSTARRCPISPHFHTICEFSGYWNWLWCPGLSPVLVSIAFPLAFHTCISVFFHSLFFTFHWVLFCLFFTVAVSAPRHQTSSLNRAWDRPRATVDPEAELNLCYLLHMQYYVILNARDYIFCKLSADTHKNNASPMLGAVE